MHGARAIIAKSKHTSGSAYLLARRLYCVVVAALANKLAPKAWAGQQEKTPAPTDHIQDCSSVETLQAKKLAFCETST